MEHIWGFSIALLILLNLLASFQLNTFKITVVLRKTNALARERICVRMASVREKPQSYIDA